MVDEIYPMGAPYPKAVLGWDGTDYRVFAVDADGQLQVDVLTSALPAGGATAANQAIILTRMPAVLFNFDGGYHEEIVDLNGLVAYDVAVSPAPAADHMLVITTMVAWDATTNITTITVGMLTGADATRVHVFSPAAAGAPCIWSGHMYCAPGSQPQARFWGTVAGDDLYFDVTGYVMALV